MKEIFLKVLRDRDTPMRPFREAARGLSRILAAEAAASVAGPVVLIPILRAGLTLLPAFEELFPEAPIGFFGIRRDEKTSLPHLYYEKLPPLPCLALLLDPMLATGGSACLALDRMKAKGQDLTKVLLVSVIAAPEGVRALNARHPQVRLISAAIDEKLDAKKYIVPGIGDFGDRYFGTPS